MEVWRQTVSFSRRRSNVHVTDALRAPHRQRTGEYISAKSGVDNHGPSHGNVQKLDRGVSGRFLVVEAEKSAEALPADDRSRLVEVGGRQDELAGQPLMVSLLVVMRDVLADHGA